MYKEYGLPFNLYVQLKKSVSFENKKDLNEVNDFLDGLPHKLKMETAMYIYEDRFIKMRFL